MSFWTLTSFRLSCLGLFSGLALLAVPELFAKTGLRDKWRTHRIRDVHPESKHNRHVRCEDCQRDFIHFPNHDGALFDYDPVSSQFLHDEGICQDTCRLIPAPAFRKDACSAHGWAASVYYRYFRN